MKFIHLTTTFFLLALTHADSVPVADLKLACELLPDQCPSGILEALELLSVYASITVASVSAASSVTSTIPPSPTCELEEGDQCDSHAEAPNCCHGNFVCQDFGRCGYMSPFSLSPYGAGAE